MLNDVLFAVKSSGFGGFASGLVLSLSRVQGSG